MGALLAAPIRSQLLCRTGNAQFRVGCAEMQGFRHDMEDAHSVCLSLEGHPDVSLFAVYDGHAGDKVAHHLAENLPSRIARLKSFDDESLRQAVVEFDQDVGNQEFKNMGSTCVFALLHPEGPTNYRVTAVNVGDSRVMIVRANGTLVSMTEDHKPDDALEKGRILSAGGTVSNNRVDGGLAMSRAIGDFSYKMNSDLSPLEQKVIALPDVRRDMLFPGDRLLVVCDGVVERISNKEVANYVHQKHKQIKDDPALVMRELLFYSLAKGSTDNQSAILVCLEDGTGYERPDQFLAGPLSEWSSDRKFVNAYLKNAKVWGQTTESLPPLIQEAEAKMPKDWRKVSKPDETNCTPLLLFLLLLAIVCYMALRWESRDDDFEWM